MQRVAKEAYLAPNQKNMPTDPTGCYTGYRLTKKCNWQNTISFLSSKCLLKLRQREIKMCNKEISIPFSTDTAVNKWPDNVNDAEGFAGNNPISRQG